ncbi:hypothetical protein [Mariniblastus fucicola]|uniref:Uncharacterized protein n=1 Tax=Mariniblastus fucicola TaxID=980251 RepID=A0A5B9P1Y5_9BACT|nr:hypothetical protein [Mariniblastus fucicola]QEG20328.1 hypothetical protein MFFC18_01750 [Mariniblastus fucicola]
MNNGSDKTKSQHTIRLRGPCHLLWMQNGTQQATVRVQVPCEISPDLFELSAVSAEDSFVLRRSFAKPTRLERSQSVTLELNNFEGAQRVLLNRGKDSELAQGFESGYVSLEVGHALIAQNRLEVEFPSLPSVAGEIQLVIQQ